ncbi:hypothetical protein AX17_000366 [Amanita inopinata Kibby_2008]|nr:hypothetical protein AX17_000366 [Amanita inopinata Kibby_2008]
MKLAALLSITSLVVAVSGDPNDWVNVKYITQYANNSDNIMASTSNARASVMRGADYTAQKGPWSITNSTVLPPSNDPHDYLSWAPYHWPNCNWCKDDSHADSSFDPTPNSKKTSDNNKDPDPYEDGGDSVNRRRKLRRVHNRRAGHPAQVNVPDPTAETGFQTTRSKEESSYPTDAPEPELVGSTLVAPIPGRESVTPTASSTSFSTETQYKKTSASHSQATKTSKASCTPSPTTSMAPSATWTTCPYIVRDGIVNPEVRSIHGPGAMNNAGQAIIYNAVAYAVSRTSKYAQNVAFFIDTFFLNTDTRMNPSVEYGQIVRGPGPKGRLGTFTGILDLRGTVKIVNGISILRAAGSADWSDTKQDLMEDWMSRYASWLSNSEIGKVTASRPNNHGSFYVSQMAAAQMFTGNRDGAIRTLQKFSKTIFLDQIAASGEQPFEAVRTRPYHYRCFNLEALITNAKLGDELGLDLWSATSKYGATIQTAVDFAMTVNAKKENIAELAPHVASVAAAYGDAKGKYAAFLKRTMGDYESKPFWLYDQPSGVRRTKGGQRARAAGEGVGGIEFECPAVFAGVEMVEVDDGVFKEMNQTRVQTKRSLVSSAPSSLLTSMTDSASSSSDRSVQVKLVLLGEAAVGKSSVVLRFVNNEFQPNKEPTIGAAFLTQKCRLDDRVLRYEIWDTAGQERFHSLAPMYYRNAQAAVVVYDVTKASSLEKAKSWVKELQRQANPNIVIALAGNKVDLVQPLASSPDASASTAESDGEPDDATATPGEAPSLPERETETLRQVPREEAHAYATEAGLLFFETSAKTGEGIVEIFTEIAKKIPIEDILAASRSGSGRSGAAGSRPNGTRQDNLNLEENPARSKDACNC